MASEENSKENRTRVNLFIRASVIDRAGIGSCPISQQWFLATYSLHLLDYFDLFVKTVAPGMHPEDYSSLTSKKLPLLHIVQGVSPMGEDISDIEYDDLDEFLPIWKCDQFATPKESKAESQAEKVVENLYVNFNKFLVDRTNDGTFLKASLLKLDDYLAKTSDTKFMLNNDISYADCILIPKLQHVRVAAKAYKNFDIPTECTHVWRYLKNVYETDAFDRSCPPDEDIIAHYEKKSTTQSQFGNPFVTKNFSSSRSVPDEHLNGN